MKIESRVLVYSDNDGDAIQGRLEGFLERAGLEGFALVSMTASQSGFLITLVAVVQREQGK